MSNNKLAKRSETTALSTAGFQPEVMEEFSRIADKFAQELNKHPKNVKKDPYSKADYIPIDAVESMMDSLFRGMWETYDFEWQVVANEIVGTITIRVLHPHLGVWIRRTGASATLIRQTKGANLTDISKKIKNTLGMDIPRLKADCIKNACKSLGKRFGRTLNRKEQMEYYSMTADMAEDIDNEDYEVVDEETGEVITPNKPTPEDMLNAGAKKKGGK